MLNKVLMNSLRTMMENIKCNYCGKTNDKVFFVIKYDDNSYICSECIDNIDNMICNSLKSSDKDFGNNIVVMSGGVKKCNFCKRDTFIAYVKLGESYICLDCVLTLFEIAREQGFSKYKKSIKNVRKLQKLLKHKINSEQKLKLLERSRLNMLKANKNAIQSNIKGSLFIVPFVFLSLFITHSTTMSVYKSFIYILQISLFFFFINIGSVIEISGITNLFSNNLSLSEEVIKLHAKKQVQKIAIGTIGLLLLSGYYYFSLDIKSLAYIHVIPMFYLIFYLLKSYSVYCTPSKIFDNIKNNIYLIS